MVDADIAGLGVGSAMLPSSNAIVDSSFRHILPSFVPAVLSVFVTFAKLLLDLISMDNLGADT